MKSLIWSKIALGDLIQMGTAEKRVRRPPFFFVVLNLVHVWDSKNPYLKEFSSIFTGGSPNLKRSSFKNE